MAVSLDPLVVNFGDLGSLDYNDIQFGVQIDPALTEPTLLEYVADITWQGGHIRRTFFQIANAKKIYLPTIQR